MLTTLVVYCSLVAGGCLVMLLHGGLCYCGLGSFFFLFVCCWLMRYLLWIICWCGCLWRFVFGVVQATCYCYVCVGLIVLGCLVMMSVAGWLGQFTAGCCLLYLMWVCFSLLRYEFVCDCGCLFTGFCCCLVWVG